MLLVTDFNSAIVVGTNAGFRLFFNNKSDITISFNSYPETLTFTFSFENIMAVHLCDGFIDRVIKKYI